jgi:hypothetical protein
MPVHGQDARATFFIEPCALFLFTGTARPTHAAGLNRY